MTWWERVTDVPSLGLYAGAALFGAAVGLLVGVSTQYTASGATGRVGGVGLRAVEGALMAAAGAFLARLFVSGLLALAGDSTAAGVAVGWGFFLVPGAVDSLVLAFGGHPLFTPPVLLTLAAVVGGFTGAMDGGWRVHQLPTAWLTLPLDVTWGLAGSTVGVLLHLINFWWGEHADYPREGAHRYFSGFALKPGYAFTQGSVRSSVRRSSGDLHKHELLHVKQNRYFGPLFTLTYLGWMAVLVLPAAVVGLFGGGVGKTVENWCYANNPWETWAYDHGGGRGGAWSATAVWITALLYFPLALAALGYAVYRVWFAH